MKARLCRTMKARLWLEFQHHPTIHRSRLQIVEDAIDVAKFRQVQMRANLAFGCEFKSLREILSRSDNRAAHSNALQDNVEDWGGKLSRR